MYNLSVSFFGFQNISSVLLGSLLLQAETDRSSYIVHPLSRFQLPPLATQVIHPSLPSTVLTIRKILGACVVAAGKTTSWIQTVTAIAPTIVLPSNYATPKRPLNTNTRAGTTPFHNCVGRNAQTTHCYNIQQQCVPNNQEQTKTNHPRIVCTPGGTHHIITCPGDFANDLPERRSLEYFSSAASYDT